MHAEMEILVKEVIEAESRHPAKENVHLEKILDPKKQGDMQTENQGCVPPSEADLFEILVVREEIGRPRTEDTVVDQGMGLKWIRPDGLVHQKPVQNPFEKTGVKKKRYKPGSLGKMKCHFSLSLLLQTLLHAEPAAR